MALDVTTISTRNPALGKMLDRWRRYRAFAFGDVEDIAIKRAFLPKGSLETDADYTLRCNLSHPLAWSEWAVKRMAGGLTKCPASYSWPKKSKVTKVVQDRVAEFVDNVDGARRSLPSYWAENSQVSIGMGLQLLEVAREGSAGAPFVKAWQVEELYDFKVDDRGDLEWVLLVRTVNEAASPESVRGTYWHHRILYRDRGIDVRTVEAKEGQRTVRVISGTPTQWDHNLNMVPVVPSYAYRKDVMVGGSYVDSLSRADHRILQLDSDQSMSSFIDGNPSKKLWIDGDLKQLGLGTTKAIKLKPGHEGMDREDIEYLQLDTSGMEVREKMIDRAVRHGLTIAGIDPAAVIGPDGAGAGPRSGSSVAWSFTTAEAPTLSMLTEEMDATDRGLIELVVRYHSSGQNPPPSVPLSDAIVTRPKKWDMAAPQERVDLGLEVLAQTPSQTHKRAIWKNLAGTVPGNLPPAELETIAKEIDDANLNPPAPPPVPLPPDGGPVDQSGRSMKPNPPGKSSPPGKSKPPATMPNEAPPPSAKPQPKNKSTSSLTGANTKR